MSDYLITPVAPTKAPPNNKTKICALVKENNKIVTMVNAQLGQ